MIKPSTIRISLALVVHYDWQIKQLDISNVFLYGSLVEEVFMEQPQGFLDKEHLEFVCRLNKALYGLKQEPRAWFHRLSYCLLDFGLMASLVNSSLFIYHNGKIKIFMLI